MDGFELEMVKGGLGRLKSGRVVVEEGGRLRF